MLENKTSEKISLDSLSELTGFPVEVIVKELFSAREFPSTDGVSLAELRQAMLEYINETMLQE